MNIALILSGGTGTRLGCDFPKQYIEIGGKPMISYSVMQLALHKDIDAIQIVADQKWQEKIRNWLKIEGANKKFRGFSSPGKNRQLSILHGLEDIRQYALDSDYVLIHDAARPLLKEKHISACLKAVIGHDGVIPVLPMKDTVYCSIDRKKVSSLLDRNCVFAGQAPEVFALGKYYHANMRLMPDKILKINGSTEPAIMANLDIAMIPGDENNFKVTTKNDMQRFRALIEGGEVSLC